MQPSTTIIYIRDFFCKLKQKTIPRPHLFCPKMICYAWKKIKILEMAGKCLSLFLAGRRLQQPPSDFLSHRQTPAGAVKLRLSDYVGTFIVHILVKNISGNVSSGHQNRSRDPTSRVLLLKFEVVLKPNCYFDRFQTFRVLWVYLKIVYLELCISAIWGQVTSMTHYKLMGSA